MCWVKVPGRAHPAPPTTWNHITSAIVRHLVGAWGRRAASRRVHGCQHLRPRRRPRGAAGSMPLLSRVSSRVRYPNQRRLLDILLSDAAEEIIFRRDGRCYTPNFLKVLGGDGGRPGQCAHCHHGEGDGGHRCLVWGAGPRPFKAAPAPGVGHACGGPACLPRRRAQRAAGPLERGLLPHF